MTIPRFLQIHTLHSYPAALLNRDDSGLAKRHAASAEAYTHAHILTVPQAPLAHGGRRVRPRRPSTARRTPYARATSWNGRCATPLKRLRESLMRW